MEYHRTHVRNDPKDDDDALRDHREHQVRILSDPVKWRAEADRAQAYAQEQREFGIDPETIKASFTSKSKTIVYPKELRDRLHMAVLILIREIGGRTKGIVSSGLLFVVCRGVVDRYDQEHPNDLIVPYHKDGRRTYFQEEFYRPARYYMDKNDDDNCKTWTIKDIYKNPDDSNTITSMSSNGFAQQIVNLSYDEGFVIELDDDDDDDEQMEEQQNPPDVESAKGYELEKNCETVQDAYNEWFGHGRFENQPIPGGIQACEKHFGTEWREHLKRKGNRFGDQKKICLALHRALQQNPSNQGQTMAEWEGWFRECGPGNAKTKLGKMKKKLKEGGKLKKFLKRGRHVH